MKYYLLEEKVDEGTLSFPVLEFDFERNKRFFTDDNGYDFPQLSDREFYERNVPFPSYQLVKGAQRFDNLSGEVLPKGKGLFVSEKFKSLIESLKTPPVTFYPLELVDATDNAIPGYYFMQMIQPDDNTDYPKSTFAIYQLITKEGEIRFASYSDYLSQGRSFAKERKKLKAEHVVLTQDFANQQYELFFNLHFSSGFILSQKAKELFLSHEVTGIEIKETSKITGSRVE